jgi:hypothetical protein
MTVIGSNKHSSLLRLQKSFIAQAPGQPKGLKKMSQSVAEQGAML